MSKHASQTQHTMPIQSEASMNATFDDISLLDRSMYYWAHTVQTFVEWRMHFDITQLPSFTPPDASTFLYFTYTNFECQQQSIYTILTCLKTFIMESKYFTTDVCKCMHAMYDMHDPNTRAHDPNTGSSVRVELYSQLGV